MVQGKGLSLERDAAFRGHLVCQGDALSSQSLLGGGDMNRPAGLDHFDPREDAMLKAQPGLVCA